MVTEPTTRVKSAPMDAARPRSKERPVLERDDPGTSLDGPGARASSIEPAGGEPAHPESGATFATTGPRSAVIRPFLAVLLLVVTTSAIFAVGLTTQAADAATAWSRATQVDPAEVGHTSVSCPTAAFCAAVDNDGYVITYDGTTWSSPINIDTGNDLTSVS